MLEVEAVIHVVGWAEVVADGEYAAGRRGSACSCGKDQLIGLDSDLSSVDGKDGIGSARIALNAVRSCVARTIVEEGIQIGCIEEEAEACAYHGVLVGRITCA